MEKCCSICGIRGIIDLNYAKATMLSGNSGIVLRSAKEVFFHGSCFVDKIVLCIDCDSTSLLDTIHGEKNVCALIQRMTHLNDNGVPSWTERA